MDDRIKKVMAAVFEIDAAAIHPDSTAESIENWDSVRHMSLVLALEEEFGVRFNEDEIAEMMSFERIHQILSDSVNKK